jgi:iron complex transport system ATP-binding protein
MMADDETALETVMSGKHAVIDYWGEPSTADRKRAAQILKSIECSYLASRL